MKVWRCLAKVILPKPKRKEIGSKTYNFMFIGGYVKNSVVYKFKVLKNWCPRIQYYYWNKICRIRLTHLYIKWKDFPCTY